MKFAEFLNIYFGQYKIHNVDSKLAQKLQMVCNSNFCGDELGLCIFLVLLKKRKSSMVPKKFKKLYKDLGCYTINTDKYTMFITLNKNLVPKIKKIKTQKGTEEHISVGTILDYPSCCIRAFISEFLEEKNKNSSYRASGFDNFTLHAKCKKSCRKSEKLKMKYAHTIKRVCPKMYLRLLGFWFCLTHLNKI